MKSEEIEGMVKLVIAGQLQKPEDQIHIWSRLKEDLGADSMDMAEIAIEIEDKLALKHQVDIHALAACVTVQDIIDRADHFNIPF